MHHKSLYQQEAFLLLTIAWHLHKRSCNEDSESFIKLECLVVQQGSVTILSRVISSSRPVLRAEGMSVVYVSGKSMWVKQHRLLLTTYLRCVCVQFV
jgi:hypothetical protein